MTSKYLGADGLDFSVIADKQSGGLSIGVIGCGYWGSKHVRVLNAITNVRQVVIVEPDPESRAAILSAFPAARGFPDLASALPHVDAIVIATPPTTHFDLALSALKNNKHVLVEKPLTTSVVQAQVLVRAAREAGKVLMAGHTFLFVPAVRELKCRLDKGELGPVHYIHSARLNLGLYRPDVNVIWDLAPHDITIMNYLLQSRPDTVSAWGASFACGTVEDVAYIRLDYKRLGVSGYCHLSWLDPRKERTITVVGTRKMAVYDDLADERLRIYDCGVRGLDQESPPHERPLSCRYGDIISPFLSPDEPLASEDQHFVDCIRKGTTPESSGVDGMVVIAILEALDRSLEERALVEVDYPLDPDQTECDGEEQLMVG